MLCNDKTLKQSYDMDLGKLDIKINTGCNGIKKHFNLKFKFTLERDKITCILKTLE